MKTELAINYDVLFYLLTFYIIFFVSYFILLSIVKLVKAAK
jgi:hypothetical protein